MSTWELKFIVRFMDERNAIHKYVSEAKEFFYSCPQEKFTHSIICDEVKKCSNEIACGQELHEILFTIKCSNVKRSSDFENFGAFIYKQWCQDAQHNEFLHWLLPERCNIISTSYNIHYGNAKISEFAFGTLPNMRTYVQCYAFRQIESLSSILCSFSHLERHFILYISNTHKRTCEHTGEMGNKMLVYYDSLIKIVAKMDHSSENPVELFLHLEHPPCIYVTRSEKKPDSPNIQSPLGFANKISKAKEMEYGSDKFERTFEFGCKCNRTLCDSKTKIGKSLILKLVIADKFQARWLIEQLILRRAKKTEIYFSSVNTIKLRIDPQDLKLFPWLACESEIKLSPVDKFNCDYAWKALHSRSYIIAHQILLKEQKAPDFAKTLMNRLAVCAYKNPKAVAEALFQIADMVDKGIMFNFQTSFERNFCHFCNFIELNQLPKGMCYVRRAIITPSKIIFHHPYEHFDNRIIRKFGVEYMLRVSVQDDNFNKLTFAVQYNSRKESIMKKVWDVLMNGLTIGSRKYELLASSSSQLREHGMWMYAADPSGNTASIIRSWMGDFSGIKNVAKYMARMGQCLSTTEEGVQVTLDSNSDLPLNDIESSNRRYIFSDGIGKISSSLASEVREALIQNRGLDDVEPIYSPSAFQIRYKGCKGMVLEDPTIEGRKIGIRPSMNKFECDTSDQLEIVKTSAPRRLFLNKHLITILEQMGIPKETFLDLQCDMMLHLLDSLTNESQAVLLLMHNLNFDFPFKAMFEAGFSFTNEPFFRSMLLALFKSFAAKLRSSMRIAIPERFGRNMLGVLDETGSLKYGEVFIQYSESTFNPTSKLHILEGPVIVTKNPSLHPGDVRKLTAVNKSKALHHIKDCIVFPANPSSSRPHPDEMAGSDLDGDEFVVLWYGPLIFSRKNARPMDYPVYKEENSLHNIQLSDVVDFFCHYIQNDCIGSFAHAHLVWADKLKDGIFSKKCMQIAERYPYVLDFAKHGTTKYLKKSERSDEYPDFMQKGLRENSYHSKRALGSLYRTSRVLDACSSKISLTTYASAPDPHLICPGWEEYKQSAELRKQRYTSMISEILRRYDLNCEAEAFCGMIELQANKKWRQEKSDTMKVIKSFIRNIMYIFKSTFLEEVQEEMKKHNLSKEEGHQKKLQRASAWYMVAYSNKTNPILSFPWVISDVLAEIKSNSIGQTKGQSSFLQDMDADIQSCMSSGIISNKFVSEEMCMCQNVSQAIIFEWISKVKLNIWSNNKKLTCVYCFERILSNFRMNSGIYCCSSLQRDSCRCSDACSPSKLILEFLKFFVKKTNASIGKCVEKCDGFLPKNLQELSLQTLAYLSITRNVFHLGLQFNTDNFTRRAIDAEVFEDVFDEEGDPIKIPVKSNALRDLIENDMDEIKEYLKKNSGVSSVVLRPEKDLRDNLCLIVNSSGKNWQRWNLQEIILDPNFTDDIQRELEKLHI